MDNPDTINVTDRFRNLIMYGFVVTSSIIGYFIVKQIFVFSIRRNPLKNLSFVLYLLWFMQIAMMGVVRLTHTGHVCSGDYKDFVLLDNSFEKDHQYDKYFLEVEGKFFFWMAIIPIQVVVGICIFFLALSLFNYRYRYIRIDGTIVHFVSQTDEYEKYVRSQQEKMFKNYQEKYKEEASEFFQKMKDEGLNMEQMKQNMKDLAEKNPEMAKTYQ